jgi:hypothetical protein
MAMGLAALRGRQCWWLVGVGGQSRRSACLVRELACARPPPWQRGVREVVGRSRGGRLHVVTCLYAMTVCRAAADAWCRCVQQHMAAGCVAGRCCCCSHAAMQARGGAELLEVREGELLRCVGESCGRTVQP